MDFIPKNNKEEKSMLKSIGVDSLQDLFSDIPEKIKSAGKLNLGRALPEAELKNKLQDMTKKNKQYSSSFLHNNIDASFLFSVWN